MARPAKSVDTMSKNLTHEEYQARKESEILLRGGCENLEPPEYLTDSQKELFEYIKAELEEAQILGNLDVYILSKCAIAIDRLQAVEEKINKNNALMFRKEVMSVKDKYDKDFYRCCSELSLSPQSRAKLSSINMQAQADKEDELLKALQED